MKLGSSCATLIVVKVLLVLTLVVGATTLLVEFTFVPVLAIA